MSLERNLKLAELAVEYTNEKLSKGASNKWADVLWSPLNLLRVDEMRDERRKFTGMGGVDPDARPEEAAMYSKIRLIAHYAEVDKVGNCGECASVAFMFLAQIQRYRPLAWMGFLDPGDHAWVVLGRARNSVSADYRTWGPTAVVCDPWGGMAFKAIEVPQKLPCYHKYKQYGYGARCILW